MVVQLTIPVGNVDTLLGLGFTRIEVWHSTDAGNYFQEITESAATPATLDALPASNSYRLGGKLLKLSQNGAAEVSILFSTLIEFWTPTQVASRINEVVPGLASVVSGFVRLTATGAGRISSVAITYSDGVDLGWSDLPVSYGKEARPTLVSGTLSYVFTDLAGRSNDLYKWRFSANSSPPVSDFSDFFLGKQPPALGSGSLSSCVVNFVGLDGRPEKRKIIIAQVSNPASLSGRLVTSQQSLVLETDDEGFLQFTLVRGSKVRVAIEGSSFVREFTVPNAATFDLLQVMSDAEDSYSIQTVPPYLIRRSI